MPVILHVRDVAKSFHGLRAVNGISLDAPSGRITAVIGPNGAGKTTLFNCLTGIVRADRSASTLDLDGASVSLVGRSPEQVCRLGIARTFQQVRLFDSLSAVDNVLIARSARGKGGVAGALLNQLRAPAEARAGRCACRDLLARVGIRAAPDELAGNLDHGSRRRLEIARALASEPKVILLDEPAAGMNHTETAALMRLFAELRDDGLALLLIEHDMRLVMGLSDRIYVMDHGELLAAGTPSEIVHNPAVIEAYLGRSREAHAAT
jgi:branched-chain amino acid transport system ATP-binding protein